MDEDRVERVRALGYEHARIETEGDLAGTMATLVADPVYEFRPEGGILRGHAGVERYYVHLMEKFLPQVESAEIADEWCNESSLAQEYDVALRVGDKIEKHRVAGILVVGDEKLLGERIYGSERALRLMLGDDLYDELEPFDD
jgi:hypothetical protein